MYTPQLLGMLPSEIKMGSKDGEELFPRDYEVPDGEWPSDWEREVAGDFNKLTREMASSPWFIEPTGDVQVSVERFTDRFKAGASQHSTPAALRERFAALHADNRYDKSLVPNVPFEELLERKKGKNKLKARSKRETSEERKRRFEQLAQLEDGGGELGDREQSSPGSSQRDPDENLELDEEEDYEDENDYADNYFDNGEDDDIGDMGDDGGGGDDAFD